ncbi:hypothetical protein [Sphingobacterium endophyticum]|uniref:hypothetical protein n=1 Tax=Sphingobacterium endophyticum TaxID=2546448 RepID=UPI00374280A8
MSALLHGNIAEAFMINPLGILSSLLILSVVVLLILDLLMKKDYYFRVYRQVEKFLQTHQVFSIVLILLVITNWIWNISKGL